MSRNIFLTLMVAIFPFALKAQETKATEYPFMGYTLGKDETHLQLREIAIAAGTSCQVNLTGFADGNPYKTNSRTQNQDLSERRASNAAKILNELGIDFGRIHAKGIAVPQRGPQYRGVKISLDCPVVSAPMQKNDSLATVTKAVDTLKTDMQSAKKDIEATKDTTAKLATKVDSIIAADTGKKNEGSSKKSTAGLEIGLNYSMGQGFTVGPNVGFDLNDKYKIVVQGGLFPAGESKSLNCSLVNISGALGVEREFLFEGEEALLSSGAFTDRTACYDGGPNVAETLTLRYDGIFIGGGWKRMNLGSDRFRPTLTVQGTLGLRTKLENQTPKLRAGIRISLRVPLFGESTKNSATTNR